MNLITQNIFDRSNKNLNSLLSTKLSSISVIPEYI
jgi:hypothetical protein